MRKITSIVLVLLFLAGNITKAAIGEWTTYLAYGSMTDIEPAGNNIFVLSSGSLFVYHVDDHSIDTYDKARQLTDTGIAHIAWCATAKKLVIVYDNQNIDLLHADDAVTNICDYKNKNMTADKTVNNITINGNYAYLSTGFGIIKLNVKDAEISDTYNLGMQVTDCAILGHMIYAQTAAGVYAGNTADNLLDKNNWQTTTERISFSDDNDITVSTANGYTEYVAYDKTNKCYWSNQADGRLQGWVLDEANNKTVVAMDIAPDAPKYNYCGKVKIRNGQLASCNGMGWSTGITPSIQLYDIANDSWTTFSNEGIAESLGIRYQDIMTVDIDPSDPRHVMAGSQAGLFEFYDGKLLKHWNDENSPIYFHYAVPVGSKNFEIVSSVLYDKQGNLWVANTGSNQGTLLKLKTDGTWDKLNNSVVAEKAEFLKIMGFDSKGNLWMFNDTWDKAAAFCYNPATETLTEYANWRNEDGVSYSNIDGCRCMAEDKQGNLWVGISQGLFVLTQEYLDDPTKGFYQVKVPRNDGTNYADYLLSGMDIKAIAIDSANRKWVGTGGNGIYLISADNIVQEAHFTTDNSPLLSNTILSIAIDETTGMVYIGTDKGLCSYQSEAGPTNEEMTTDNVWAYPNPVTPDYDGVITVTGLSLNTDVKILSAAGTLVKQGRSTGGSFVWDGRDADGKRVASGVYMVVTATESGEKGTVCKISIIN